MQAVWRARTADPGAKRDVWVAGAVAALLAFAGWGPAALTGATGATSGGPGWVLAALPLLLGAPLVLRRRKPLAMWAIVWSVVVAQLAIGRRAPAGVEIVVLLAAGYWLGEHATPRRSAAGLALATPVLVVFDHAVPDLGGVVLAGPVGGAPARASLVLLVIEMLACWLAGVLVRTREQAASLTARNDALVRQAGRAAAAERARIARELHDVVAHHLSVMVLQAAGARAAGRSDDASVEKTALGKIERSGRRALAETRLLLGVLRDSGQEDGALAPQPGLGELPALAESVRAAGLPISLDLRGDLAAVPETVGVSAYRIVQEALTNVLKHAGPASASVAVGCADGAVAIEVTDDGAGGAVPSGGQGGGHGLAGMRERAAVFGGELHAGPRPGGGFAVRARLPLGDGLTDNSNKLDDNSKKRQPSETP